MGSSEKVGVEDALGNMGVVANPGRVWLDLFALEVRVGLDPDHAMELGRTLIRAGKAAKEAVEH